MNRAIRLIAMLACLGACAAPETLVEPGNIAAFAAAATYAVDAPDLGDAADRGTAERMHAAVESEITRALSGKGYERAALAAADLKVSYRLASMARVPREAREDPQAESRTRLGPGDPYGDYQPLAGTGGGMRRGLLLLTITDVKSGAVVWQATSEGEATSTAAAVGAVGRGARVALSRIPAAQRHRT